MPIAGGPLPDALARTTMYIILAQPTRTVPGDVYKRQVVGLVTVLFAAYSPAKKAAKVSPLAAVSGNANGLEPARNTANTRLFKIDTAPVSYTHLLLLCLP